MPDQTKALPAKDPADAYAAAVSAQPVAPAPAAPKADTAPAETAKAEPVKPAPVNAPVAKAEPVAAPNAVTAKPAPAALAPKPQAATAPKSAQAETAVKPVSKAAKPNTAKAKSTVVKSPVAVTAAEHPKKKENTMTTTTTKTVAADTKQTAEAMTDRVKTMMGDVSARAKTAYEKGSEMVSQAGEFSKGNVEALVESGKIAAKGVQDMGQTYAEDTKKSFEELTAALKEMTSVKSPTEFIELQSKMVRKSFDTAIAQTSKNSEAFLKLAGDVIQPISNRVSIAVDSFKKAA